METKRPDILQVELTFTEPLLGSIPASKGDYARFILSGAPEEEEAVDELETVPEEASQPNLTTFHRDPKLGLIIYDYVIKGFLKQAVEFLHETGSIKRIPRYKHRIDSLVFVSPRRIPLRGKNEPDGQLARSLRALTPKGLRTVIAVSDFVKEGTQMEFEIIVFPNPHINLDLIRSCLDYGQWKGLGQWNSGGYGKFTWREISAGLALS